MIRSDLHFIHSTHYKADGQVRYALTHWQTNHFSSGSAIWLFFFLSYLVNISKLYSRIRRHSISGYFPQKNTEGPDIWLGCELVVSQTLGCCPLDGELCSWLSSVCVLSLLYQPRQTKISDLNTWSLPHCLSSINMTHLHHVIITNQTIPRSQITMDEILGLKIAHSRGNLSCDVHQHNLIDFASVGGSQIIKKIPSRHELSDDVEGWFSGTDSKQLNIMI